MKLSAQIAQLAMLAGESLNRTPNAGIFDYKLSWGAGTLYVFAEGKGPGSEYICRLAIETIGREFGASSRSLTSSLISSIRAGHDRLVEENRQSLRDHRTTVAVTCAVARGKELFLAQAGPAVTYTLFGGGTSRIPADSSRNLSSWSTPLGGEDAIEVTLTHYHIGSGDTLLMASSLLAAHPVEGEIPSFLALGPEHVLLQLNQHLQTERAFSALAVGFQDASKRKASAAPRAKGTPPTKKDPEPARAQSPERVVNPQSTGGIASFLSRVIMRPGRKSSDDGERVTTPKVHNGDRRVRRSASSNGRRRASASVLSAEVAGSVAPILPKAGPGEESAPEMVWSKRAGTIEDRYGGSLPRRTRSRARDLRLPLFLLVLFLSVLVVYSLTTCFGRLTQRQTEARYDSLLKSATVTWERAAGVGDLAQSRRLLNDAEQMADEALTIKKGDAKTRALKQRIAADLAKLSAVVKLPDAKLLTDLAKVEVGVDNLTDLVVEGENAFILDRGSSRAYQFGLDLAKDALKIGKSTLVAKKGDRVGEKLITDIVNILWMGAGGGRETANLLIFDSARSLFEYAPGKSLTEQKVRGAQAWINPALALGYNSNLYVLDPSASQVWRYFPTSTGYDSEMRGLLENADIKDAVSFAIDRDIFVLTRGGKVLKFVGGRLENFDQDQLDKGLAGPTAIYTTPKTRYVYVVDAGNNRIVVFTKDGKFQRQFVGEALDVSPMSIHVDEARGKIYILADKKLYLSNLPK